MFINRSHFGVPYKGLLSYFFPVKIFHVKRPQLSETTKNITITSSSWPGGVVGWGGGVTAIKLGNIFEWYKQLEINRRKWSIVLVEKVYRVSWTLLIFKSNILSGPNRKNKRRDQNRNMSFSWVYFFCWLIITEDL